MSRLRPFRARVGVAGAASLAALSLLVTSLTPFALRASAAEESTQATDVASSQDAATASSESEAAAAPAADTDAAGAEAPAAARDESATLAMTVVNDYTTLRVREDQITTINFSCSSVTTPCQGAVIEMTLPGPITPAGLKLIEQGYTVVPVTSDVVAKSENYVEKSADGARVQRYRFTLKDPLPAGTSDRIQIPWRYNGNDAPNNSTTTQHVVFSANNAASIEQTLSTTWTASTDVAIEKSGPTNRLYYPAVGGEATYELRYGYQQNDTTKPNSVGTRWGGTAYNGKVVGIGFQQVQNIKVVDPLPAQAVFVSASNGGVYDAATHSVTWSYDKWAYQTPIESTVTVKYPAGTVTTADTVTNKATITAEGMNEPTNVVTKSSEITHGFAERRVEARAEKIGTYNRDYARGDTLPWRFEGSNSGNTTLHYRWEDTMPCTWSSQDGKAAGDSCDQPAFVGPYEFKISTKSGYEEMGGWTFEYWTNKGNHETVTYKNTRTLTLPDGEWITRFVIETDAAPLSRPTVDLSAAVSRSVPKTEPSDFTNHYNAVLPPERYYDTVASEDYVRIQNCASVVVTDKDTGAVALSNDNTCSWTRIRTEVPGVQVRKELNTNPVVVGKPANFMIVAEARKAVDGGTPTPFTVVDLLPEGLDVDDASNIRAESYSVLKNPDGTAYDPAKVKVEVEKNFNNTGRTLIRWIVPDPVEGAFFSRYSAKVLTTAPAGDTTNTAWAFMPGGGAKPYDQDRGVRNLKYCIRSRAQDTLDLNQDGSTTDFLCDSSVNFKIATTAGMNIAKEVKGNKNADFVPAGQIAEIDPGADGAYRFTIANAGNAPLTKVVAYDILPHPGDVGVGPAANQARESRWKPNLNSTNWTFQSVKERQGRDPEITTVPASDITIQYSTVPNPCRGEVLSVGGSMNDAPAGCTPDAWGDAPADLASITGFRIVMNRDIEVGEKIQFVATMTSPVNANLIAWNSVAMSGGSMQNGKVSYLLPNEAPKVGINVSTDVAVAKTVSRVKMNGDEPVRDANGIPETLQSTEPIMPGDYMLYRITLNNKGPAVASGMTVKEVLPAGVEYISAETRICQDGATNPCTGTVKADSGFEVLDTDWRAMESGVLNTNLYVGGTETLYVLVQVQNGTEGKTITNTASLGDFDQIDSNKDNNTASASFTVGGTISGTIYNDKDATWFNDSPVLDSPFEGVTVRLLDADGNPVKDASGADITAKTDADGKYTFTRLPMGSYKVEVVPGEAKVDGADVNLSDYKQTYGYGSSTDRTQVGQGKLVTPSAIELTAAAPNVTKVDFGFVKPASVGDYVWFDANKDGLQDSDEPALPGITATIVDASGNPVVDASGRPVSAVTTGADGKYTFENLLPGDYKVSFQAPAGYEATVSDAGADRAKDSNGASASVSLVQGQTDDTIDFGAVGTGVIGDQLFVDVNQNGGGAPDAGDKVLPNVKVTLTWTGPGGITRTFETVTDADGKYKFENLLPGEYKVSVDPESLLAAEPLLDVLTHSPAGDVDAKKVVSADVKADKDKLAQAFKLSASVTLTGEKNQNLDQDWGFGVSADTAIRKAITTPDEQAQESFEFIPGAHVTYTLTLTNNGPGVATGVKAADKLPAGVVFESAAGDGSYDPATGVWDLSGLTLAKGEAKKVAITVVITGEGAGKLVTNVARITHQDQVGDDPTNNESSASFKGGFNLGGTIYRDSDASYSKSDSEQRFKGVTVALLGEDGTPVLDANGNPMTTTTDEKGAYQFVGLAPASYRVVIVDPDKGDLAGLIPTQAYTGRGETQASVTITDASVQGVDFGLVAPATIGDRVWYDEDGNGADNGEPGAPNVTVILKDANGVELARTTTDANGNYRFTGLIPGTYTVDIEVPAGYNAATTSMTVTVGEGEENLDVDFPLTLIPAPTPTPTPTPSTTVAKVLARTGSDASVLGGMAAMAAIAGFVALAGKRRREHEDA